MNMIDIKEVLLLCFTIFLIKNHYGVAMLANKSPANDKIKQNQCPLHLAMQQLAKELHKPIIRKLKKKKVESSFKVNI